MRFFTATLRRQLLLAFAAVALIFSVALVVGWLGVGSVNSTVKTTATENAVLQQATGHTRDMAFSEIRTLLDKEAFQDAADDLATFRQTVGTLRSDATDPGSRAAMKALDAAFAQWLVLHNRVLALAHAGQMAHGAALAQGAANDAADALSNAVAKVGAMISKANTEQAASQAGSTRTLMLALAAIGLLLAAAIALLLSRDLTGPMRRLLDGIGSLNSHCMSGLREGLHAIAAGDLTKALQPVTKPIPD
ncbi:MAG TPA: hypothetical protein VMU39_24270 [Solirubrobacteraceae bacterium]|nr:hypothetical protein [Solirubrobacteraceae bacterium]